MQYVVFDSYQYQTLSYTIHLLLPRVFFYITKKGRNYLNYHKLIVIMMEVQALTMVIKYLPFIFG